MNNNKLNNDYQRLLKNLLCIGVKDKTTLVSVNKTSVFDLHQLLSATSFSKIFSERKFSVDINNLKNDDLVSTLSDADSFDDFTKILDESFSYISKTRLSLLRKDFFSYKNVIINFIKKDNKLIISKWKRFKNEYLDLQDQTNAWPLYVGTMFYSV